MTAHPTITATRFGDALKGEHTEKWSRGEWEHHFATRDYVGASEVAAVLGLSKYAGPFTVWGRRTGRVGPEPENDAMWLGRAMEPIILDLYQHETGRKLSRVPYVLRHPDCRHLGCNLDAALLTVGRQVGKYGAELEAVVDAKHITSRLAGEFRHWAEHGEPEPETSADTYAVQLHTQMAVTGAPRAELACLIDKELVVCHLEANDAVNRHLVDTIDQWWARHIEADEPPTPNAADLGAVQEAIRFGEDTIDAPDLEELAERRKEIKAARKELDTELREIDARILARAEGAKRIQCGRHRISRVQFERLGWDLKALEEAGLADQFKTKTSTTDYLR